MLPADSYERIICEDVIELKYFGDTDTGRIRKNNEDSFVIKNYDNGLFLAVVADGMGGHAGGQVASSVAVKSVIESVDTLNEVLYSSSPRKIKTELIKILKKANNAVYEFSNSDSKLDGMGTTAVVCTVVKDKLYVCNVGDSRLYVIGDNIRQITKDHSLVTELIDAGVITSEQAKEHPQRNVITKALGTDTDVEPDIFSLTVDKGKKLLICTDGLSSLVSDKNILEIIRNAVSCEDAVSKLITKANDNGGQDNITAVVVNFDGGEE